MTTLPDLQHAKRLVIKTGSALVTDEVTGKPHARWMASLAADIAALMKAGKEVILVSSGAVSLGRGALKLAAKAQLKLPEKQAAAACGQVALMDAWGEAFAPHNIAPAQLLLTLDISEARARYLNARQTILTLLELGAIPVVNENDTVATAELKVGDNDRLAARVAEMIGADALVILSDIDGFYTADPNSNPDAKKYDAIHAITPEIEAMAGGARSNISSGGMATKIQAAKIALASGCHTLITSGKIQHPLQAAEKPGAGTWFVANATPATARKRWIGGKLKPTGSITLDAGAEKALGSGKSLLAAGITAVSGEFAKGEAVSILSADGKTLGTGLIAYDAAETRKIMGKKSEDFEAIIGYKGSSTLIHRDDLALN